MPSNLVFVFGKVSQAAGVLVINEDDVRGRVWAASDYLFAVHPEQLPPSYRKDIEWIHHMLMRYPVEPPFRSCVEATYHRTRNVTASKIAARVWNLYHSLKSDLDARDL